MPEEKPEIETRENDAPDKPENEAVDAPSEDVATGKPAGGPDAAEADGPDAGRDAEGGPGEGAGGPALPAGAVKAEIMNRVIARFIDVLVALLLARLPDYIGFMAGLGYLAAADGWLDGASVGKRVVGIRAVREQDGGPAGYRDSILRNSTVCILYAFLWVPLVGWALAAAGAAFEFLLMLGSPAGKRLGDEVASTVVVAAPKKEAAAFDTGAHTGL